MGNKLTVIMYHYVRDLKNSRYPAIKGCDVEDFREQVGYITKHYVPVTIEQILDSLYGGERLPEHAVLFTFDDAYADHFTYAFPILYHEHIQGVFFPPVKAVTEHTVLDVNKIHFILAATRDSEMPHLLNQIKKYIEESREEHNLDSFDDYYHRLAIANSLDNKDVMFVKRLLQAELPETIRKQITSKLFVEKVGMEESLFSRELYMSLDQIKCMVDCGMHVGSHGYDHLWFSSLTPERQEFEIKKSMDFIEAVGGDLNNWSMCYPNGKYNDDTLSLLKQYGCKIGFTTRRAIADLDDMGENGLFLLPRLDTNNLPKDANAAVNEWYY